MTAPPMQTAEDYARQGEIDPLEPPTMPYFSPSGLSDIFSSGPAFAEAPDTAALESTPNVSSQPEITAPRTKSWYNPF
jgi:hypothetical protein